MASSPPSHHQQHWVPSPMTNVHQMQHPMQHQAPALQRSYQVPGYNDYAGTHMGMEMEQESISSLLVQTPVQLAQRCKSSDLVFPQKLHMLLTASEQDDDLQSIVSWKVHGRAFAVHDRKRFLTEILPEWFLQSRFESFQRQLNLYGFRRITTGPDRGACYHELFLRQKPLLATRIQRIRLKGKGPRQPAKPELEPNFYRMTLLPTLEMVKKQAYQGMYYASCGGGAPPQPPAGHHPGAPPLAVSGPVAPPLVPLMPKPTTDEGTSVSSSAQQKDSCGSSGANPNENGLCALMLRPHARSAAASAAAAPSQDTIVPYKASSLSSTAATAARPAAIISHPPSPAVFSAPQQQYAPAQTSSHGMLVTAPNSPGPMMVGPGADANQSSMATTHAVPVSRSASQTHFSSGNSSSTSYLSDQQQQQQPQRFMVPDPLAGTGVFLHETGHSAMALVETVLEEHRSFEAAAPDHHQGTEPQGEDDDFAHILFELANGHDV